MPAATSGSPIATSTDATTPPMPDANATKPAFGLTAKIFLGSPLRVVAVLGVTFGLTSIQANRTADASIHRALLATRRAVDDYLAARTRTLSRASTVATDVPQYRQRLLNQRDRAEALDQADDVRGLIGAAWVLVTNSEGVLIARTDYREQYDRDLSVAPLVANALSGDQTSGAWLDDVQGTMFIAIGTPLRDRPTAAPLDVLRDWVGDRAGAGLRVRAGTPDQRAGPATRAGDTAGAGRRLQRQHRREIEGRDRGPVTGVQEPRRGSEGESGAGRLHD